MLAIIDGWQCVVLKSEFKEGDQCVYFEIDSLIPMMPEVEHLRARAFKRLGDKEGIRIKTIKLRGQLSQGLALPIMQSLRDTIGNCTGPNDYMPPQDGMDVTDMLGVIKYELPIPDEMAGQVRGNFPGDIPKTYQQRCQNIVRKIFTDNADARYEVSMKMDGASFTGYTKDSIASVCGRNWDFDIDDPVNIDNKLVRLFVDSKLKDVMLSFDRNFAVQGEIMGPGFPQNREQLKKVKLFVFDIFNIVTGKYLPPTERHAILEEMYARGLDRDMVQHVPVLHMNATLEELGITNINSLLAHADGPSIIHPIREGEVWKRMDGDFSFKVISNKFLLKQED